MASVRKSLASIFLSRLTSELTDLRLAQWFCYAAGLAILLIGGRKIATMQLTEPELLLALLLAVITTILFTLTGLILWLATLLRKTSRN